MHKKRDRGRGNVTLEDMVIFVQCAREEAERTGRAFDEELIDVLVDELRR